MYYDFMPVIYEMSEKTHIIHIFEYYPILAPTMYQFNFLKTFLNFHFHFSIKK